MSSTYCNTRALTVKAYKPLFSRRGIALGLLLASSAANAAPKAAEAAKPPPIQFADTDDTVAAKENASALDAERNDQAKLADPATTKEDAAKIKIAQESRAELIQSNAQKFPDSFPVQQTGAAAAIQAGDWKRGEQYANKALILAEASKDPQKIGDALQTRAIGALQAKDYAKAEADAKRLLDMRPKDVNARMLYETVKGRAKGTAPAPAAAPAKPGATYAIAPWPPDVPKVSVYNDPRLALDRQRALDRRTAAEQVDLALGKFNAGKFEESLQAADAALRADPTFADAHMQKSLAWTALKELANALVEITKAINLWTLQGKDERLAPAYAQRANLRNEINDYPAALTDADRSLAYNPKYGAAYFQRARAVEGTGEDFQRALADYKKAAEYDPNFTQDFENAVARLSAGKSKAPSKENRDWLKAALAVASAFFAFFVGLVWKLSSKSRPESNIAFTYKQERKELDSQYDIVSPLGEGGMGAVYKGWDKKLKRPVAVKKLRSELQANPRERERFLKEAELVASLHHPHIVDIYTIIKDADTYLVFEYVSGSTLHDVLNDCPGRRMAPKRALEILKQIGEAVDHAHGRHVIHRDLKPSNVMLADGGWVKVMDFGIARQVMDSMLTTTNTIVGTPVYMAPEQAMGAVVKESDVFALGITLYELLTGALPFKGPNEMNDKLEGRFTPASDLVPELGTALDAVFRKALAPRAEDRYRRCSELHQAAEKALNGSVTPATQR